MATLRGRSLTHDFDLTAEEISVVFDTARDLKGRLARGESHELLRGRSLSMIFQKPSTRTRVSFEVAMTQLGGHALYLGPNDLQLSRGETVVDTGRVLSRYCQGIMARVFGQQDIVALAAGSSVPVINGLSDSFHPCQSLTDLFTVFEKRGTLRGLKLAFVGDGDNNVTNSLLLLCSRLGVHMSVACPRQYRTRPDILFMAESEAKKTGSRLEITEDPVAAVHDADVIYTDVWVSMGRTDTESRILALSPYQVNEWLVAQAPPGVLVMHCLPAHRGQEITDDVMDGPNSVVFDQAENRLHIQKALLSLLLAP